MTNVMHVPAARNVLADVPASPPLTSSSSGLLWAIAVGVLCVAVVVAIFLLVRARDKKGPPNGPAS